ncbi:hypothetical protein Q4519_11725 [Motilimonas sp. 1_MG-2023]|uniref:IS66 family insertion sequence element accessory protein TnpA n=1 Tax=Motilimonas sp. 1_MG-2023 TaxID=3062672 RepID=UPI0026E3D77D|nr:hypothetical protein [Motilimonas sp. 1_MG-2023]MDO6526352.1 hypothetical protein [Motilimonas sp. 1_MG-2023]
MSHSQHWQHHIDAWQQAGSSQAQYCREHELDQSQFSYWKRKLIKTCEPQSVKSSRFAVAQVAVMSEPASSLSISFPCGIVLSGIDANNAPVAATLLEYLR